MCVCVCVCVRVCVVNKIDIRVISIAMSELFATTFRMMMVDVTHRRQQMSAIFSSTMMIMVYHTDILVSLHIQTQAARVTCSTWYRSSCNLQ